MLYLGLACAVGHQQTAYTLLFVQRGSGQMFLFSKTYKRRRMHTFEMKNHP